MKTPFIFLLPFVLICFLGFNELQAQDETSWANFSQHKILPGYGLRKLSHPEIFQGNLKRKKYFEGWYFKMVSKDGTSILSVIPGISLSGDGKEQHAFIQIIDGISAKTEYYPFPITEFSFSKKEFAVKIGRNYFSKDKIILNIQTDSSLVSGEVRISEQVALSAPKILNPGIMGWYRFVPFMQCYHGVVSLTHRLDGNLVKDGKAYDFDQGKGYIEKDWGSSMPSAWIWIQSNNFLKGNSSFMLSIANVPWLGKPFTGFLGFFLCDSTLYRFATYTHAKLQLEATDSDTTKITVKDRRNTFSIKVVRNNSGLLLAPVKGSMDRRIAESIDAKLYLTVRDRKGNIIFDDSTSIAGFEKVGDQKILEGVKKRSRN